jgi:hypothetical protein
MRLNNRLPSAYTPIPTLPPRGEGGMGKYLSGKKTTLIRVVPFSRHVTFPLGGKDGMGVYAEGKSLTKGHCVKGHHL